MTFRRAWLAVLILGPLAACSEDPSREARVPDAPSVTSTTPGSDHLEAPDLGCVASLESRAIDYTGGAADLDHAIEAEFPALDSEVVSANEKYAWVTSTASKPFRRALFVEGGSGWALLRVDSCAEPSGEPLTPLGP